MGIAGVIFGIGNLRANTPTIEHPKGWQINVPENMEEIYEQNGAIGGRNYRDLRVGWVLTDPGRKSLD